MTQRIDDETAILTIAEVARWDWDWLEGFNVNSLPEGWTFLGSGISRWAFLAPDGWVYKFGEEYSNEAEVRNAQRLYLEQDDTLRVPWVEFCGQYGEWTVIRCEYICGEWQTASDYYDGWSLKKEWMEVDNYISRKFGLSDLHYGNVCFVDGGVPAAIDLGR